MSKWIQTPSYPERMPVDISFVFEKEKPAGKHGFLRVDGEHFRFEDGTRMKFFGVCLSGSANFPEHEYAEKMARRLAEAGVNCVRNHWMDSEFNTPNIFAFTKGRRLSDTRKLDERSMDRLDYLIFCLKQQGIYIYLDNMTFRKFKSGDGVAFPEELAPAAKPYSIFDPKLIELQMEYATQLWTHLNPYTGLRYCEEPAVILTEITNENDLFRDHKTQKSAYYENEFRALYRSWLEKAGKTDAWETVNMYSNDGPLLDFKTEITMEYYRKIYDHLRSIGVKIPINGTNWYARSIGNLATQKEMDFTDAHHYYYDWLWNEESMVSTSAPINGYPYIMNNLNVLRTSKPFFVSEWGMPYPNEYRAEGPIYYAAVAALQDYDGMGVFAYQQGRDPEKIELLGSEMSSFLLGNYPFETGVMSVWNDPALFGLFYHAALMFRRSDVSPAKNRFAIRVTGRDEMKQEALKTGMEKHRLFTVMNDEEAGDEKILDDSYVFPQEDPDVIISDHAEMRRYLGKKVGVIDTPRTKVVYGMLSRNRFMRPVPEAAADGFAVRAHTDFGVIALSSLTDDPIEASDNMLLSAVGRAMNSETVRAGEKMMSEGHPPVISEVIEAEVAIRTERRALKVWAVNPEGYYIGTLDSEWQDGMLTFSIGKEKSALYYLIAEE